MDQTVDDDLRALVNPSIALEHFRLRRWSPPPLLHRFVDRFWMTRWDLPEPFSQTIVTYPAVNMVIQSSGAITVSGPQRRADHRRLEGRGWAFAVMFRPAGFRPFIDFPLSDLADRSVAAADLFGPTASTLADQVISAPDDARRRETLAGFLADLLDTAGTHDAGHQPGSTTSEQLSSLIDQAVAETPPLTKGSELAARHGCSLRTLQRLFADHVGLGPKTVLQRYRVLRAAEAARGHVESWADLALELGYADQAHLTADLRAAYGAPPATYARTERSSIDT